MINTLDVNILVENLKSSLSTLSDYSLVNNHHWEIFLNRLSDFNEINKLPQDALPHYNEEQISRTWVYNQLQQILQLKTLKTINSLKVFFIFLGIRITAGTIFELNAVLPPKDTLLESCRKRNSSGLSVVARAHAKHASRSTSFWPLVTGSLEEKNNTAIKLVEQIYDKYTWWNSFTHTKIGDIIELRVSSGHGARWEIASKRFIGFVEPIKN